MILETTKDTYTQHTIGRDGGVVTFGHSERANKETYRYIENIKIGDISMYPMTYSQMETLVDLAMDDPKGIKQLYPNLAFSKPALRSIFKQNCFNRNYFMLSVHGENCGYFSVCKDDNNHLKIAPYVAPHMRGQGVMKKAYTALAETFERHYGLRVKEGYTLESNISMQRLFKSVGLKKINDAPCSSLEYKVECAIFER